MTNILDIPGNMTSLCNKTEVVLLLILQQAANLVLRGYKAPHLLGEIANPLFLMFQFKPNLWLSSWLQTTML